MEFDSFSECVSNHFLKIDKFETKEKKAEVIKEKKISKNDKAVVNIQNQIDAFELKTIKNIELITNIELYVDELQNFLDLVITHELEEFETEHIKLLEYKKYENTVEFIFDGTKYKWNTTLSAHSNLGKTFQENKQIKQKINRASLVLADAQKTVKIIDNTELEQTTVIIKGKTKTMWFEEFNWFVTSDGLTFVSGKTADQNEQIVKKYLNDGDIYVHSEVFGSGSGVIKNNGKVVIERDCPRSLEECGSFLICHTKAWKSEIPDRAYWVHPNQVSKKPETNIYEKTGIKQISNDEFQKVLVTGVKFHL